MTVNYEIILVCEDFLESLAESFVESFGDWSITEARTYLMQTYGSYPHICFAAVDHSEKCLGAIFCKESPYHRGKMLVVTALQVQKEYRNMGIGKSLLHKAIEAAGENDVRYIGMSVPMKTSFPLSWYEKIGLHQTGWGEVAAEIKEIDLMTDAKSFIL